LIRLLLAALTASVGMIGMIAIVLIGLPFWVVAMTTRALARVLEPRWLPARTFTEYEPLIGWKGRSNVDAHHHLDDVFHVTTDVEGWRGQTTLESSDIVVLGDSFAWGYGIDDAHFFANVVAPGLTVKTVGVMGYNLAQEFLWLERLAPRLRGKLVVWLVYLGNDLIDTLLPHKQGYTMPFMRRLDGAGTWEIVTSHVRPAKWVHTGRYGRIYYETLAKYCTPSTQARREYSATESLFGRAKRVCEGAGARLVVVTIPDKAQLSPSGHQLLMRHRHDGEGLDPDLPDREIRMICDRLGIAFVAGTSWLDAADYKELDVHWNEKGHRRVAELLTDLYRRNPPAAGAGAANGGRASVGDGD